MKELTIEQKAKAYDEAIERANSLLSNNELGNAWIYKLLPELKENKDEKIKNFISNELVCLRATDGKGSNRYNELTEAIAWLEKQGEKKPDEEYNITGIGSKHAEGKLGEMIKNLKPVNEVLDQEHINKVEPKFHEGDWVTNGEYTWKVISVSHLDYTLQNQLGKCVEDTIDYVDTNFHLWTIQDAKNGDALSDGTTIFIFKDLLSDGSVMSYCDYDTDNGNGDSFCPLSMNLMCSKITPATKEQRGLLFQKIKEAGYEWNAEKKELRKIEQKSAWDEEDEIKIKSIIAFLKSPSLCAMDGNKGIIDENIKYLNSFKKRILPQQKQDWSKEDERLCSCLIKEQEKSLDNVKNDKYGHSEIISDLKEIYNERIDWLKSIKERMKGE